VRINIQLFMPFRDSGIVEIGRSPAIFGRNAACVHLLA